MMKMENKLENVERIGRANQHKQFKIMTHLTQQAAKGQAMMNEKKKMLETRF